MVVVVVCGDLKNTPARKLSIIHFIYNSAQKAEAPSGQSLLFWGQSFEPPSFQAVEDFCSLVV